MFTLPEGVSIVQAYMGDYGEDGNNDILLLLSDGAWMLIEPQEEGASAPIEATPPSERSTPREEFEPYDPEPTERGNHDNIQGPQRSGAGAPTSPSPGSGARENSR